MNQLNKLNKLNAFISICIFNLIFSLNLFAAEPLVSSEWLNDNLTNNKIVILDIRNKIDGGSKESFEQGHIPNSVYSNYLEDGWRTTVEGIVGKIPALTDLEILIGSLGIDNNSHVIIVPGGVSSSDFGSAARVYWTFKVLGHEEISILDGGYKDWDKKFPGIKNLGFKMPKKKNFKANFQSQFLATTDEVLEKLNDSSVSFIDARSEEQYLGEKKHGKALSAGTIPGAINFKQFDMITENTTFVKDLNNLEELAFNSGVDPNNTNIAFCNTGHWAATAWFTLSEVLKLPNTKMYDGSMVEWTADTSRPLDNKL